MNSKQFLNGKPINEDHKTILLDKNVMPKPISTALQFDKERQSVILQSIGDAVIATDMEGDIILMNPVAEKLTGWKFEDAENKPISEVFHIVDNLTREEGDNLVKTVLRTGKSLNIDPDTVLISRNKKKEYSINDSCAPIFDIKGNIMGVVLVFRDVTKEKQEEALKEKMTADLVQRNKDHEHFSNIISHDIRSPVANIISLTALVNDKDLREDEREFMMNALTTSAERLDEVIIDLNVILSMGKQLNDKKEHIYFSRIVRDVQDSIANVLEKEQVHFELDFSQVDKMFTIKSYMYSILYNLISNSIKYRRQDVPLEITVKSKSVKEKTMLTLTDNGLGVDLNKSGVDMFGLYKRFHADQAEGKGMGLYMVKVQVEKLGGTISVKSEVNKGTEFIITLNP
ncbi:sensor histidine kinase [Gelidibacter gilvus]|uniref:histidine kinase n=1 Tax=Gelidibacter gilvus TaxID=59602 RepID=A0A4Q0XD03_9FLAO|nr:HAMP domain-containing sensor histidine kinase [Gelidibacter gilvus]RXJ45725.1 PAS domain-containing protein [Gelidibacter gilvus]